MFLEVQALASTDDLTMIQGWIRKAHLQHLDCTSSSQVIDNLDLVAQVRHQQPGKLRVKIGAGSWEALTPEMISDFQQPTPRHFVNQDVTTSAGELHPVGRWIFCRGGEKGDLGVSKTIIHMIDEKKFPLRFRRRGLGRQCLTCGQRIQHYRILGGGVGGYIPSKSRNSGHYWDIRMKRRSQVSLPSLEQDDMEEANQELESATLPKAEEFPQTAHSKQKIAVQNGTSSLGLLQVGMLGHIARCSCRGSTNGHVGRLVILALWILILFPPLVAPNLDHCVLPQISMPMIICEACYRYSFCGQDGVVCLMCKGLFVCRGVKKRMRVRVRDAERTGHVLCAARPLLF